LKEIPKKIVLEDTLTINPSDEFMFEDVERVWPFSFNGKIGNDWNTDTVYIMNFQYDDKSDEGSFWLNPAIVQQVITESTNTDNNNTPDAANNANAATSVKAKPIPSWVKVIATAWGNNQISDDEYIQAMKFLISSGIIEIASTVEKSQVTSTVDPFGRSQ